MRLVKRARLAVLAVELRSPAHPPWPDQEISGGLRSENRDKIWLCVIR